MHSVMRMVQPEPVMNMVAQSGMARPTTMQSGAPMQGGMQQTTVPQQSGEHPYSLYSPMRLPVLLDESWGCVCRDDAFRYEDGPA